MVDILVVDDEEDLRELVSDLLTDHGYSVHAAADGLLALNWLREQDKPPRIILLDMMMPCMDGPAFRKELLGSPEWSDIPIVLMTASVNGEDVVKEMGAKLLIKKPLRFDAILCAVREFIQQEIKPTG